MCEERGLDLTHYRRSYLERRFAVRLRALGLTTYREYAEVLERDPAEYAHFLQTLTINVTEFFRDPELWDVLRVEVIPQLIATKRLRRGRVVRVWSAGCATGEEPYSLAMTFLDVLGKDRHRIALEINATDLDSQALAFAEEGAYPSEQLAQIPEHLRAKYVVEESAAASGTFGIAADVRRFVHYEPFSLFDSPPMNLVDLVVCRNVLIYFDRAEQSRVLDGFYRAMSPDAYLVLGRSEKLPSEAYGRFETIDGRERVYRKIAQT
jgi:chemotaxis methyl-accepting protein methylase